MTTTAESLEKSYNMWQEWATSRRASYRGRVVTDLLSEDVDPVEESHMMLPSKQAHFSLADQQEWPFSLLHYVQQGNHPTNLGAPKSGDEDDKMLSITPPHSIEFGISTIVSLKMRSVRSRLPICGNTILVSRNSAKPNPRSQRAMDNAPFLVPHQNTNAKKSQHLHRPEILCEEESSFFPRRKHRLTSSLSVAPGRQNERNRTACSFASAPKIADVPGMHIPPELHASSSFILEQQAIWNNIMSKAKCRSNVNGIVEQCDDFDCKPSAGDSFHNKAGVENFDDEDAKDSPGGLEGQQIAFHGSLIKILGRSRVYEALANGTTKIITCIGCETNMLATHDTKLLFCPDCGTLTPSEFFSPVQPQTDFLLHGSTDGEAV